MQCVPSQRCRLPRVQVDSLAEKRSRLNKKIECAQFFRRSGGCGDRRLLKPLCTWGASVPFDAFTVLGVPC